MTKLLEQAVETVRGWPADVPSSPVFSFNWLEKISPWVQLSAADEASLEESLAQADRGEFATDEQVREIWAKYKL
jgi:hypothetical protein